MQNLAEKLTKILLPPGSLPDRRLKVKSMPETPGVYLFFKDRQVIYVGKAINLKRRIYSYFDLNLEPKTSMMVSEANSIGVIKVTSELEALLLEAKLIRRYMPHYNIAAKDDKHPLYIEITKEKYPRIITVRKIDLEKTPSLINFGPFPSTKNVRSVLRMLRRIFPYSDYKVGPRGCLYSHIGLCKPCPSEIEKLKTTGEKNTERKKYLKNIKRIKGVLSGQFDGIKNELVKEMELLSSTERFEEAAEYRNKISSLDYITQPQMPSEFYMENPNLYEDQRNGEIRSLKTIIERAGIKVPRILVRIECYDIAHLGGTNPTASMVTFINGEADKNYYRHFKIKKAKGGNDYASLGEVARRRGGHFGDWGRPDLIIVDGGKGQVKAFASDIPVVGIAKHPDRLIVGEEKIKLTGSALNLVSRMRDEAHRFARRYHHALISKEIRNENHP